MQIKRFEANSMKEALELVKKEFGPDAVILSARTLGVQNGISGFIRRPRVELTAATDRGADANAGRAGKRARDANKTGTFKRMARKTVDSIMQSSSERASEIRTGPPRTGKRLFSIYQQLLLHGVDDSVALDLVSKIHRIAGAEDIAGDSGARMALNQALKIMGASAKRLRIEPGRRQFIAFVGPTGSGKTTTAAKFAAACLLHRKKDWIGLLTLDNDRIGSVEQLKIYTRIIGISLERAWCQESLASALDRLGDKELILVDTPGITKGNMPLFKESMELLHVMAPLQSLLVASSTTQLSDLRGYRRMLEGIPLAGFVFTKLDEAMSYGNIITELVESSIPLAYTTSSQNAPGGIQVGDIKKLTELIINEETEEQIGTLPPEALAASWARLDMAIEGEMPARPMDGAGVMSFSRDMNLSQIEGKVAYAV